MKTLIVELGERSYPIHIGSHLLANVELFMPHIRGKQVCIVTNQTVAPLYLKNLLDTLKDYQIDVVELPDGEQYKNLQTLSQIYDQLLRSRHHRTTTLIALGGGVVGDMTGFAAATFQRGVDFIQVPTTLLAQVDSSVGGKTGVNHPLGKNMIGAFHQPNAVIVDTDVFDTLPPREFAAGLAEVIKYGLIADADFFRWLEHNLKNLLALDVDALSYAIERSCAIKAEIVAEDERESGIRALLNLGHTFGHAIEVAQGYGSWLHGEAVAVGMVMAADLSCRMEWLSNDDVVRVTDIVSAAGLPVQPPSMSPEQFLHHMAGDKKVLDGQLRLVLLKTIGQAEITADFPHSRLMATLSRGI